jgi:hypothetical protein
MATATAMNVNKAIYLSSVVIIVDMRFDKPLEFVALLIHCELVQIGGFGFVDLAEHLTERFTVSVLGEEPGDLLG